MTLVDRCNAISFCPSKIQETFTDAYHALSILSGAGGTVITRVVHSGWGQVDTKESITVAKCSDKDMWDLSGEHSHLGHLVGGGEGRAPLRYGPLHCFYQSQGRGW